MSQSASVERDELFAQVKVLLVKQRPKLRFGAEQLTLGSVGLLVSGTGGSTVRVDESDEAVALAREDLVELDRGGLGRGDLDGGAA